MKVVYFNKKCFFSTDCTTLLRVGRPDTYTFIGLDPDAPLPRLEGSEVMLIGLYPEFKEISERHKHYDSFHLFGVKEDLGWDLEVAALNRCETTLVRLCEKRSELLKLVWSYLYPNLKFNPEAVFEVLE